ncbi:hypothetical protein PASE110613_12560 [Paenibacillus sediminis]|uniref:Uncharacterized protein n=1 Tax=Paenibacillus sediminis TaxID=664909 RepID=A0ABS4H5X5_9BACL|nr:hypothetical protein [Paenibacillus sediminis]MBP1937642.1 hypothetical protein [Paenibacillus sediminis]
MKTRLLVLGIPLLLVIAIVAFFSLPWILIFIGIQSQPNPPRPEITYGEFPFRLEYEIKGERKVIQDTLICEFDGFGADEGRGKYRKWKQRLASGNVSGDFVILEKLNELEKIGFYPGSADYYMNDSEWYKENNSSFPNAWLVKNEKGDVSGEDYLEEDQLFEKYHIKLISWEPSPPIKNSFIENKK